MTTTSSPTSPINTSSSFDYDGIDQRQIPTIPTKWLAREFVETILLTILIFFAVNSFTGRFRIEGQSMEPTMHEGQYIVVNKISYAFHDPTRGDVVVINYPRDPSRDFIKRVIGIPGDVIKIEDGVVTVNGAILEESDYIIAPPTYEGTWTVPENNVYVLGDNRLNSSDSHQWGFVPYELIEGKGAAVYWPISEMQLVPHVTHENIPDFASVDPINEGDDALFDPDDTTIENQEDGYPIE